jgi:hypothetical protein
METPFRELPDQILAVSDIMVSGLPRIDFITTIDSLVLADVPIAVDYPLRL